MAALFVLAAFPKSYSWSHSLFSHSHCHSSRHNHGERASQQQLEIPQHRVNRVLCTVDDDAKHDRNASSNRTNKDELKTTTRDPVSLGYVDDFNRDYYDELKAEFADNPLVTIYSKDDYVLDDTIDDGWLGEDLRGRDLNQLRETLSTRPIPDNLPFAPLHLTDLHSAERVKHFNSDACSYDPTTGIPWEDVPHDMHMYPDCEFSDLRHVDEVASHDDEENITQQLPFEPMKRKPISEKALRTELMVAMNELEEIDSDSVEDNEFFAPEGNVPTPTETDLRRWKEAAEARGGNALTHNNFVLRPQNYEQSAAPSELPPVPPQYSGPVRAHLGRWIGEAEVIKLEWSRNSVVSRRIFEIESDIDIDSGNALLWETSLCRDTEEECVDHVSSVKFVTPDVREELYPERAFFECGSYIAQIAPVKNMEYKPLSLSRKCIEVLTGDSNACIELCMRNREPITTERMRIVICGKKSEMKSRKKKLKGNAGADVIISHVITIRERRVEAQGELRNVEFERHDGNLNKALWGKWRGRGVSLHPLYPSVPCKMMTSFQKWCEMSAIKITDVTWTEIDLMQMRDDSDRNRGNLSVSGTRNQRHSSRVRAAAKYDSERLAKCSRICEDVIGGKYVEKHAWSLDEKKGWAVSPRLGKFVNDYFAMVLTETMILIAPAKSAWPSVHSTVTIIEKVDTSRRRRLIANRSIEGQLVGALLLEEELEEMSEERV